MPSNRQYRFFHGKLLPQICEKIGVKATRNNQEVIKSLIKARFKIDTMTDLNEHGMALVIEHTSIFFATEFGIVLDMPGEKNTEEQDLKTFLKHIYHGRETNESSTSTDAIHEAGVDEV